MLLLGLSAFPFVGFAFENRGEPIDGFRLLIYGLVVWLVAVAALWGICTARQSLDIDRSAIAVGSVVFSFFAFSWWLEPDPRPGQVGIQLLIWTAVTAVLAVLLYRLGRTEWVRTFVLFAAVALPLVPTVGLVFDATQGTPPSAGRAPDPHVTLDPVDAAPPNIYHFVLDFHARADQFETMTGADYAAFVTGLEDRGFVVAGEALTSYPITALSMSSTLDMGYGATSAEDLDGGLDPFFDVVRGDNRVVESLHEAGYTFVYSPNGTFNGFDCSTAWADLCISPTTSGLPVSDLDYQLLELTPLGSLDLAQKPYTDPGYVMDQLDDLAPPDPFFLLAHVVSPHPPYRFEEDCSRRRRPAVRRQEEPEEERANYATDVRCIDQLMLDAIDRIEARDPGAVIIVQSDHGSEFLTPWYQPYEDWSDEALTERYGVLNAMKLPGGCQIEMRPDEALVNTYPVVFGCLNGDGRAHRLPYAAYLFRWGDPDDLVPIDPGRFLAPG